MPDLEKAREEWERADGMSAYAYRHDANEFLTETAPHRSAARTYIAALEAALKAEREQREAATAMVNRIRAALDGATITWDRQTRPVTADDLAAIFGNDTSKPSFDEPAHPSPTTPEAPK
jgi:hypothetical protein